jgi:UPF0716 family protein affecting phage T7 exclusion
MFGICAPQIERLSIAPQDATRVDPHQGHQPAPPLSDSASARAPPIAGFFLMIAGFVTASLFVLTTLVAIVPLAEAGAIAITASRWET